MQIDENEQNEKASDSIRPSFDLADFTLGRSIGEKGASEVHRPRRRTGNKGVVLNPFVLATIPSCWTVNSTPSHLKIIAPCLSKVHLHRFYLF
jgi:hypothetical protein